MEVGSGGVFILFVQQGAVMWRFVVRVCNVLVCRSRS